MTKRNRQSGGASVLISLRLKADEHAHLKSAANGHHLGAYIRGRLFGEPDKTDTVTSDRLSSVSRQRMLAQILGLLGQSDMRRSLADMAEAARLGVLPLTPDTLADIRGACAAIADMRNMLLRGLGLRPGDNHDS